MRLRREDAAKEESEPSDKAETAVNEEDLNLRNYGKRPSSSAYGRPAAGYGYGYPNGMFIIVYTNSHVILANAFKIQLSFGQ